MNNFPWRFFLFATALLIIFTMVLNHWAYKELPATDNAPPLVEAQNTDDSQAETEDHPEVSLMNEITGMSVEEEAVAREAKKKIRVPEEKIIYEMPTSNKILVQ